MLPVPGRAPWAAADAKRGVCPAYAPQGFGGDARARRATAEAAKASGDGGKQLASQLGLCDRPEWRPAEGAAEAASAHLPPSAAVPPPRAKAAEPVAAAPSLAPHGAPPRDGAAAVAAGSWEAALAEADAESDDEAAGSSAEHARAPPARAARRGPDRPGRAAGSARAGALDADEGQAEEARQQIEAWGDDRGHVGGGAFTVERLLGRRPHGRGWQYLVRWQGWGAGHDSWEGTSRVHAALVAAYDAAHPRPAAGADAAAADGASPAASASDATEAATTEAAADHRSGCAALLGSSTPRPVVDLTLPGADQLSLT